MSTKPTNFLPRNTLCVKKKQKNRRAARLAASAAIIVVFVAAAFALELRIDKPTANKTNPGHDSASGNGFLDNTGRVDVEDESSVTYNVESEEDIGTLKKHEPSLSIPDTPAGYHFKRATLTRRASGRWTAVFIYADDSGEIKEITIDGVSK